MVGQNVLPNITGNTVLFEMSEIVWIRNSRQQSYQRFSVLLKYNCWVLAICSPWIAVHYLQPSGGIPHVLTSTIKISKYYEK